MKDYTERNPIFSDTIQITETSDPAHADNINAAPMQLLQNTLHNWNEIEELKKGNNEVKFDDTGTGTDIPGGGGEDPGEIPDPAESIEQITSGKSVPVLIGHIKTTLKGLLPLSKKALDVAMGKNQARVFDTVEALDVWLAVPENADQLNVGDNLYITATNVPDYWWDGSSKQPLETQKVDLTDYDRQIAALQAADREVNGNITSLTERITSFENTKAEIVSSSLGQALSLTLSHTWAQIVAKIKAVVNRGKLDWSSSNTTYTLQPGYYPGGTLDSRPSYTAGYNAGVAAGKATAASIQVRDNKNVAYISSGTQSISFTIPANIVAYCLVFCDYRTGYTALTESLSSGNFTKNDMQNLQVNVTGGHTYINRLYTISTGSNSATFTLTATGAITGMLMY